jgi:glycosyltransferase involved in cell wall biosynthesis
MKAEEPIVVSIAPSHSEGSNQFVEQFARSIRDANAKVTNFCWSLNLLAQSDAVIFHWPDHILTPDGWTEVGKTLIKLIILRLSKALFRTRLIWVAHNAQPHDKGKSSRAFAKSFYHSLDGVIYLSFHSQQVVETLHPELAKKPSLVTVHGHYRDTMTLKPAEYPALGEEVRLCYFGQIRHYKNVPELARLVSDMEDRGVSLNIVGKRVDQTVAAQIDYVIERANNISSDLRSTPVPDVDLEAAIDDSHAVVLPYTDILNSGSAFLALSRNRPIIAPRIGSLIELQATVGRDWVYLYDGALSVELIEDCMSWLRCRSPGQAPDLSPFDWAPIGRSIRQFVSNVLN